MDAIFIIIFGLLVGSFLNVVIYRSPLDLSIVFPRSKCVICGVRIKWFDLIPVLSWCFLKGKCRQCKSNISFRYPFIELLTSFLFVSQFIKYRNSFIDDYLYIIYSFIFICFLICIAFIDFDFLIIPNKILFPFWCTGLIINSFSFEETFLIQSSLYSLFENLIGSFLIFSLLSFITLIGNFIFKRPLLGMGDVKLFSTLVVWIGIAGIECVAILSILIAGFYSLVGILLRKLRRGQYIPFAPFICISSFLTWHQGCSFFLQNYSNFFWWRLLF